MITLAVVAQVFIALLGVTGIFLANSADPKVRRYGCIFGIAAAPFWFASSILAGQWGIFCLNFLYLAAWLRGFKNQWIDK